jgi:hypothetical protein
MSLKETYNLANALTLVTYGLCAAGLILYEPLLVWTIAIWMSFHCLASAVHLFTSLRLPKKAFEFEREDMVARKELGIGIGDSLWKIVALTFFGQAAELYGLTIAALMLLACALQVRKNLVRGVTL